MTSSANDSGADGQIAPLPAKLNDCLDTGPGSGAELFIVEGDSAAGAVDIVRDRRTQAVLPVQGKLLNTADVSRNRMLAHDQCRSIVATLGVGCGNEVDVTRRRYDRVLLLCDADADGIHSRSLLLIFFAVWLRPFVADERLHAARPPLFAISVVGSGERYHAWQPDQRDEILAKLAEIPVGAEVERFRGIAQMSGDELSATSLDPDTRRTALLTLDHAESARTAAARVTRPQVSPPSP